MPLLVLLILSLVISDIDLSTPSLPAMANYFKVSKSIIRETMAFKYLGCCLGGPLFGPLSERYGRKKIILIGHTLLCIGALGCCSAPSVHWVLSFRFIQGIGVSASVVIFAALSDRYKKDSVVWSIGMVNFFSTLTTIISPFMGAFINHWMGWRGNYGIVTIISLITWILLLVKLPETDKLSKKFCFKQMVLDYKELLCCKAFLIPTLALALAGSVYNAFYTCSPFLYMQYFQLSPKDYAIHQTTIMGFFALTSYLMGRIIQRFSIKQCIKWNIWIGLATGLFFTIVSTTIPNRPYTPYLVTLAMAIQTGTIGIIFPLIISESINIVPEIKGTASALSRVIRNFVIASLVALISHIYNDSILNLSLSILLILIVQCIIIMFIKPDKSI